MALRAGRCASRARRARLRHDGCARDHPTRGRGNRRSYVSFTSNFTKVRQVLSGAPWTGLPPGELAAWVQQRIAITLHALLLELHLNGTPHLWEIIAR